VSDVREVNQIERLAEYRDAWRSLLGQTEGASLFQSLDWLEVYWGHFGGGQRLRVILVLSGGRLTGVLPLVVRRERTRVGPVRILTYPLHDWGSFYGPIGPDPAGTLAAGLEYVRSTPRDWDALELRWVDAEGCDRGVTERALRAAGLPCYKTIWDKTAVVDLAGTWESYLASRPSKWRNNLRRAERRLRDLGKLTLVHFRPLGESHGDGSPRWDLYDACEQLAGRSWQGASSSGTTLSHDSIRPFLRDAHEAAVRAGAVDLHLLLLDGRPLAFAYNYHCRGRVDGLRAGYDASLARDGAGTLLLSRAIEESFRQGDRVYDLGVGSLECKRYLATRVTPIYRYSHFPRSALRAQLLRLKRSWQAKCLAGSHVDRIAKSP
jgi:CelD/BcsL family acetyltransferase involved in cellulose biosynthesis